MRKALSRMSERKRGFVVHVDGTVSAAFCGEGAPQLLSVVTMCDGMHIIRLFRKRHLKVAATFSNEQLFKPNAACPLLCGSFSTQNCVVLGAHNGDVLSVDLCHSTSSAQKFSLGCIRQVISRGNIHLLRGSSRPPQLWDDRCNSLSSVGSSTSFVVSWDGSSCVSAAVGSCVHLYDVRSLGMPKDLISLETDDQISCLWHNDAVLLCGSVGGRVWVLRRKENLPRNACLPVSASERSPIIAASGLRNDGECFLAYAVDLAGNCLSLRSSDLEERRTNCSVSVGCRVTAATIVGAENDAVWAVAMKGTGRKSTLCLLD